MALIPLPPSGTPFLDPKTGQVDLRWKNYMLALESTVNTDRAPSDAQYWVSTANAGLSSERNIGLLATGYLKITTGGAVAVPSTSPTVPIADVTGTVPLSQGGTNANLSGTGGASHVLRQSSAGAAVTVSQLSSTDIAGLASGTYTPTITDGMNVSGSTPNETMYLRVGSHVMVNGLVRVDTIAAGPDPTEIGISLPIASNLAAASDLSGVINGTNGNTIPEAGSVNADTVNNRASAIWDATRTDNHFLNFIFQYRIL